MSIVQAKTLFSYQRLDLVVKYLYAKEFIQNDCKPHKMLSKDLYIRHIIMRTMASEPKAWQGASSSKNNIDDYITAFENLVVDMKQNGYNAQFPIPVSTNGLLGNGAHRLATAAALNIDVHTEEASMATSWDFDWFVQNGFNTEDLSIILQGFVSINTNNSTIFVVWNPLFKYIDNIRSLIYSYFDIVGEVQLDFENNYVAFTNMLLEIYEPNIAAAGGDSSTILSKAKLLYANYLNFKVIVATNQYKNSDKDIFTLSKAVKGRIRELFDHILPKEIFCTVHSSDSIAEVSYLANILLSPNNIEHLQMRLGFNEDSNFSMQVRKLRIFLPSIGINADDVCVVGTGVMAALGISSCVDIDFAIDHKYRNQFGLNPVKLNEWYDIASYTVGDNIMVHDHAYHFYYKGMKFANLDIIKNRKKNSARPKDIVHLREIDLFERMLGRFEQRKALMERVHAEQQRRIAVPNQDNSVRINKKFYSSIFERIFSIKRLVSENEKCKILTILNIQFKYHRQQR